MSSCKRQYYFARSRGTKQPSCSHYNAICRDWVAKHNRTRRNGVGKLQLQNQIDLDAKAKKRWFWSTFEKDLWKENHKCQNWDNVLTKITIAALMQPFQYDLQCPAGKNKRITHAAAAPSNLDPATTMRAAKTELQSTIELGATASEITTRRQRKKRRFWSTLQKDLEKENQQRQS